MVPETIHQKINEILSFKFGSEFRITYSKPLGGGDINQAVKIETSHGNYFVKWNSTESYSEMFIKESKGLKLLSETNTLRIPEVIAIGNADSYEFLMLEYLESSSKEEGFWENFGRKLAKMHKNSADYFGLDFDNFIGSLPQSNKRMKDWIDFFVEERLNFQLKMAHDENRVDTSLLKAADGLFKQLHDIIPRETPSLLHGDLWSGNYMVGNKGEACLIDPAVYYGHREMDLGMMKLFGGFDSQMYEAYHSEYPLENGWEERMDIYNLYPLLVHVNLFGGGYAHQVKNILRRYS